MNTLMRKTSGYLTETLIILAILVGVNMIGFKFFVRTDLTENKMYTVSDATKNLLASLDDPVNVEFYQSKDLPAQLLSRRNDVHDKLEEYTAYSNGKFQVKYIDPGDNEEIKAKAESQGVHEFEVQILEEDEQRVKRVFCGLVMHYQEKDETLPVAVDPTSLEYELTSRIKKMTMESKPKIGLFAGPFVAGEQQQPPSYQGILQVLGGQEGFYEVVQIDPQKDKVLPDDLDGLIVCGAFGMSDAIKYSMDQFLLNGGQVLVAMDPKMDTGQGQGLAQSYPIIPTIEDQLEKYGIAFNKKLIADPQSAMAAFRAGFMTISQRYYLWPEIGPSGFNEEISAVSKLESLVMPWCCPLKKIDVSGVELKELASTTKSSFLISSPFELNPEQDWPYLQSTSEESGPFVLAYLAEGVIPSAFPDGPPDVATPPPAEGDIAPAVEEALFDPAAHIEQSSGKGRLIVMSSAAGLSDDFLRQFQQNVLFLANVADMMLMGDDLLGIRSTPVTARPIGQLTDAEKAAVRWGNYLGVPLLLVLLGLVIWFFKGKRRKALMSKYSA